MEKLFSLSINIVVITYSSFRFISGFSLELEYETRKRKLGNRQMFCYLKSAKSYMGLLGRKALSKQTINNIIEKII